MVDVNINSMNGVCTEYMPMGGGGKKQEVMITVSPLKVQLKGEDQSELRVISGCNLWQGCENAFCHFSISGRKQPKIEPQPS